MTPKAQLEAFAQSVHLVIKGKHLADISSPTGQTYIEGVVDWCGMFLDELENTVDVDGRLVDWWFAREAGYELGTAVQNEARIDTPTAVDRLVTDEERYVQILQDGIVISNWVVVHPKDISSQANRITRDMCAVVGSSIVFSRAFRDTEHNGTVIGDVIIKLPRLVGGTVPNVKLLSIVRPKLLLTLGIAKNASLPNIIQGPLSPSYAQKFDTLLGGAIARSSATSIAAMATRDSFGYVRGV